MCKDVASPRIPFTHYLQSLCRFFHFHRCPPIHPQVQNHLFHLGPLSIGHRSGHDCNHCTASFTTIWPLQMKISHVIIFEDTWSVEMVHCFLPLFDHMDYTWPFNTTHLAPFSPQARTQEDILFYHSNHCMVSFTSPLRKYLLLLSQSLDVAQPLVVPQSPLPCIADMLFSLLFTHPFPVHHPHLSLKSFSCCVGVC